MVMETRRRRKQLPPLPEEIIEDILKRLPVRSLVRFSCTCKQWRFLIFSDSKFNKAHIHLAKRPSWKFQQIICWRSFKRTVDCDCNIVITPLPKETLTGFRSAMLGSCNGLLFVYNMSFSGSNERAYVLWNPYTNSVRRIFDGLVGIGCTRLYGLSYDPASDDYKAVLTDTRSPYVFSLRRNSWNKLSDLNFEIRSIRGYDQFGVTTDNGMCYWKIKVRPRPRSSIIICFDPIVENFNEVPLPDEWCSSPTDRLFQIGALDGCLSLIHINIIWVMKEYGFWTKMHVLELDYIERMGEINTYKPLGYNSTKDQVVMIARGPGNLTWHFRIADVNNGVMREPTDEQLKGLIFTHYIVPYTESLLCPWLDL